jgi:hypothetical protein
MASSGNFCTLNPLTQPNSGTFSEGNLLFTHTSSAWRTTAGTHGMRTGKWYWESYQYESLAGNGFPIGVSDIDNGTFVSTQASDYPAGSDARGGPAFSAYSNSGSYASKYHNGSESLTTLGIGVSGDVWQCALDLDNGKIWFGKNNTWDNSGNPATGSSPSYSGGQLSDSTIRTWVPITCSYDDSSSENFPQNFGQDSTFSGRITAGGNADDNGFGDFKYAPPTGFLALCSANLPVSDDIDPAGDNGADENPTKQFGIVTYTGTGSTNAITGLGFQPDLIWIKRRNSSATYSNGLVDSSRGRAKVLISNLTNSEYTSSSTQDVVSIDSDGFTLGTNSNISCNGSSDTHVAWCWKANGGTTASNGNGSITATVQANTAAGFSIATYTSPGSGTNHTVGHGLSGVDFIITKDRDSTFNWYCFHKSVPDKTYRLNSGSEHSYSNWSMGSTTWGSEDGYTHNSTDNFVAYCWQNVSGMQHFGSYIGNGNSNGPFVYLGFRPRLLVLKRTTSSGQWNIFDSARSTTNVVNKFLGWNSTDGEGTGGDVDFTSSGFKVRTSTTGVNTSGTTYLYMAWADVPFKYNNTF